MARVDFASLLHLDADQGRIQLQDYRMVLLSACALGALRRELIETLGVERARGVLKRFGHAAGMADGLALQERFPDATPADQLAMGPELHGLEGVAKVERDPARTEIDLERGVYHVEGTWSHSYEAEQHLALFGRSDVPVCWTLAGYATGHSSAALGARTVITETECLAMGHDRCRFVADHIDNMPKVAAREEPDYEKQHLPGELQNLHDQLREQARSLRERERRISSLEGELDRIRPSCNLVGESPQLLDAITTARTAAPVDVSVLVLGESGTGKELLAQLIHEQSLRSHGPFVAVNCSALPETLQEAELFGYAKGAFTGAGNATAGVFEAANGGTLFLDEVGDLAPTAQTKILRALQEREIKRLGETKPRRIDTRVIAATHRDLKAMVAEGTFREDLYYRLRVLPITMPPLRERGADIALLATHFAELAAAKFERPKRRLSAAALAALDGYDWPGNVRELQHMIERGVILATGTEIGIPDLSDELRGGHRSAQPRRAGAASADLAGIEDEDARLRRALELTHGHREDTARLLGISRTSLWRRMKAADLLD